MPPVLRPCRTFLFRLFQAALFLLPSLAAASDDAQVVVIVGPPDYPPYSYLDDGIPRGIFHEIFAELSDRIPDYRIEIDVLPWKRALKSVEIGQHIAVFPPYYWPEQRPWITTYSEPILKETVATYCQPPIAARPRTNWPEDYFGLRIGLGLGSLAAGPAFFKAAEEGKLTHVAIPLESIIPHLLANKVDCIVQDTNVLHYQYRKYATPRSLGEKLEVYARLGTQVSENWAYLAFSDDPQHQFPYQEDFIRELNDAIRAMHKEGRIDEIAAAFTAD